MPFYRKSLLILWEATKMNDNVIAYILSLVCIIFILIEIVSVNKKKGMTDLIVFFSYSCPLYYFMLYRGYGGAAFTWWFYLLLLTFIHLVILVFRIIKIIVNKSIKRRNKSNKNGWFFKNREMDSYAKYSSYPVVFNLEKYCALTK